MRFAISARSLSFVSLSNSRESFLVKTRASTVSAALQREPGGDDAPSYESLLSQNQQ
jgi:hypothetical protein